MASTSSCNRVAVCAIEMIWKAQGKGEAFQKMDPQEIRNPRQRSPRLKVSEVRLSQNEVDGSSHSQNEVWSLCASVRALSARSPGPFVFDFGHSQDEAWDPLLAGENTFKEKPEAFRQLPETPRQGPCGSSITCSTPVEPNRADP